MLQHMSEFPPSRLNNVPLYGYTTFYLSIHSSVDGLLDCFTLLAIVDNAVLNMGSQVSV